MCVFLSILIGYYGWTQYTSERCRRVSMLYISAVPRATLMTSKTNSQRRVRTALVI